MASSTAQFRQACDPSAMQARPPAADAASSAADAIRVFAIDDRPLCRRGLAAMLAAEGCGAWVGEAADAADASGQVTQCAPDVILIGHRMPEADGVAAIAALRGLCPQARFILISASLPAAEVRRAVQAGAACVLPHSVDAAELAQAVRSVHSGQQAVALRLADALAADADRAAPHGELTRRERALLELMARGLENRAIAAELNIAVPTVKFHITNIMSKLQAPNRTVAVLVGLRNGLVNLHSEAAV